MSETLLHLRATGMRNGPNDYGLIKNNNTNSLYFPGAPASPPRSEAFPWISFWGGGWSMTASSPSDRAHCVPPLSASHTKPHPPSTSLSSSGQGTLNSQKQGSGELRWNALLIYSPRRRSGVAEVLLQQIYSEWLRSASRWSCSNLAALPCWEHSGCWNRASLLNTPALLRELLTTLQTEFQKFSALG